MATAAEGAQLAPLRSLLVDTGPLVAYLDRNEPAHEQVVTCLDPFRGQLHTTGAVITEVMHFVAPAADGPMLLAELVTASRMRVHDFAQPAQLRIAAALMAQYSDTPMDYADATLVLLAEQLSVTDILTLDRRGFSIYRTRKQRSFTILAL